MKLPPAHRLLHLGSVDSTNLEARRRTEAGEQGPLWIWADKQTAGRGRLGRTWHSTPGNLYATLLFTSAAKPAHAGQLGFVAALAVRDVVTELRLDAQLLLKWPNDVLLDAGKLCGLLAEIIQPVPLTVAMGFGINVAQAPQGLPYPAACLGGAWTPGEVLELLAAAFAARLALWDEGRGFAAIRSAWLQHAMAIGTPLTVDNKRGNFAGLDDNGALLLRRVDGTTDVIHAGDVRIELAASA